MEMNVLKEIVGNCHKRLEGLKKSKPLSEEQVCIFLEGKKGKLTSFSRVLSRSDQINIIAEVKKCSPSKGLLKDIFDPLEIAIDYENNGASALSILTEERYFLGSIEHLKIVQQSTSLPVLRKDFIFDPYHIYESVIAGADAVLLIVAVLSVEQLSQLIQMAGHFKLEVLVEVHNAEELKVALDCGAKVIGVNNRDLNTFEVDIKTSLDLAEKIPESIVSISESGIKSSDDIQILKQAGFNAFLIGESLIKTDSPGRTLRDLMIRSLQ
jgi:indole-3-glycerol phosphate synthase